MLVTYGQKIYHNNLYPCSNWIYCKILIVFLTIKSELLQKFNVDIQEVFKQIFVNTKVPQNKLTEGTEMSVSYFECVRKLPKYKFCSLEEEIKT